MPTDIGYTGQRLDNSTGLMYYGARYYAQGLGRFISADTIVPGAGNPQAFNRYAYGLDNPVKYIDPSGHMPTDGCQTEGCTNNQADILYNVQALANQKHQFYARCAQGGGAECNSLHDVENIVKGVGLTFAGLIAAPFVAEIAAGASSAWATGGARAATACVNSRICAGLLLGGTGAGAKAIQDSESSNESLNDLLQMIRGVNPSGGTENCVNCAIATDATLGGVPTIAENGDMLSNSEVMALLQKTYGATVDIFANRTTSSQIIEQLAKAGPSARGIVLGNLTSSFGHAFNAINYQGAVFFIDGQHLEAVDTTIYRVFYFLQTH
jgi:RHS repeat-associated protein